MDEIIILIISVIAGVVTYIIANVLKRGAVFGSAIVTLASGIILPYFFPELGSTLATAAACASYAGMISVENAPNIKEMAIISLIAGILFVAASSAYVGIGGKLGTMAAISCFAWLGFKKVFIGKDEILDK
ncbi:MAG TPA: hypothetical protein VK087_03140 [Tissierellaceae bacterium]|nr:hypothetical protein [Tissierellaceae bacterium]